MRTEDGAVSDLELVETALPLPTGMRVFGVNISTLSVLYDLLVCTYKRSSNKVKTSKIRSSTGVSAKVLNDCFHKIV